jgi:hypothetical protein
VKKLSYIIITALLLLYVQNVSAQVDSTEVSLADSVPMLTKADSATVAKLAKKAGKKKRDWANWKPDPKRAMWLAIVLPGAGQIYNRKYWKLPIVYGGILGCAYAMQWNNQMYHDYAQAYMDLCDNDPNTASYNQFLHLGVEINDSNAEQYKGIFKSRRDKYRRWRDLSFFVMLGVYALSIIDAYVDASLSKFDISDDLSLQIEPAVINGSTRGLSNASTPANSLIHNAGIGVHGALNF